MPNTEHPPFWLVWNPATGYARFRHPTQPQADAEAIRLANEHPGQDFYVLEPVTVAKKVAVEVRRFSSGEPPF